MNNPRLVFYNDARHYHLYNYEPPITLEDARAPVDEVAGTGVDTLVYGFGVGPTMFHLTEVGEIWGTRLGSFKDTTEHADGTLVFWRAYENIMSLKERRIDLLTLLIDRAHEVGLQLYGSIRTTHPKDPQHADDPDNWQFRIDHPEWCLKGRGRYNFNWAYPEVRAERLALIDEAVSKYDLDGLEIDCVFSPHYFEDGEARQNAPILTEFMREVRRTVREAGRLRGRSIAVGARVLPTLDGNLAAGMDVPAWISEGLLDFVVPNLYIDNQMDADLPFEWLVESARGTACQVWPALQSRVGLLPSGARDAIGEEQAGPEHYYAGASAYLKKGADGIYLPWFKWPIDAKGRQILSEIRDPALLAGKPKHYVVRRHLDHAAAQRYTAPLPLTLTTGLDAPGETAELLVADVQDDSDARLRVRLRSSTSHDSLTVSLNGRPLPADTARRTSHGYSPTEGPSAEVVGTPYSWLEYPLADGILRDGRNEVGVALHSRPPRLDGKVIWDGLELIVG